VSPPASVRNQLIDYDAITISTVIIGQLGVGATDHIESICNVDPVSLNGDRWEAIMPTPLRPELVLDFVDPESAAECHQGRNPGGVAHSLKAIIGNNRAHAMTNDKVWRANVWRV
jgi:hypothetical protein